MTEILYDQSSLLIALLLFVFMAIAMEAGFRLGHRGAKRPPRGAVEQISTIQSSLLGILALMLGFTFSIALERYNSRSDAVVAEAGAIGTVQLRADLLPESVRAPAQQALRDYLDVRVRASTLDHGDRAGRAHLLAEASRLQDTLWRLAVQASREAPNPATTGLYLQALDDLLGTYAQRQAESGRHVPELVFFLLYAAFITTGGIIGYSAGLGGHRPSPASYLMVALIVLLMFMVMDLDRPRRGLIQVDTHSLVDLQASLREPASPLAAVTGADRDAHGCIASAGYAWCARDKACARPWELLKAKGLPVSDEAFARYCQASR